MSVSFPKCEECGADRGGRLDLKRAEEEMRKIMRGEVANTVKLHFSEWPLLCFGCASKRGAGAGGNDRARAARSQSLR